MALKANNDQKKSGNIDTLSSRLARENILNESNFGKNSSAMETPVSVQEKRYFRLRLWHYLLLAAAIIALILLGWGARKIFFSKSTNGVQGASEYNTTSLDVKGLQSSQGSTSTNQLVINGATIVNGNVVAQNFSGNGSDLTNLNASNISLGTLNNARLSPDVALLGRTQSFTGGNSFTGSVSLPATVTFGGQKYTFPSAQNGGFLRTDGNGNLTWSASGAGGGGGCVSQCVNNGGDLYGSNISIGPNDPFSMSLRTNGTDRLTISPTGAAAFSGNVTAPFFFGNGSNLSNLDAGQITTGTLSNARLSNSVTVQGNTFNGADQLVQLNSLGYLPTLNGGNLTSLNASFVTSGTLSDARLSGNAALLDNTQVFTGAKTFTQPITVNTLTPNAAMSIGASGQNLTLQGNGSTSWTSTKSGFTTTVNFTGTPTGGVVYQFDSSVTPGTYTICTSAGCGAGGGVNSPGGTVNTLAKFTGGQIIGNSTITDNGSIITLGTPIVRVNGATGNYALDATGDINASQYLRVGGNIVCDSSGCIAGGGGGAFINNSVLQQTGANFFIQSAGVGNVTGIIKQLASQSADLLQFQNSAGSVIADVYANGAINSQGYYVAGAALNSTHLSDTSNIARLSLGSVQTFTTDNTFAGNFIAQRSSNSTTAFRVQNSGGADVLVADTTNKRVAIAGTSASYPLDVTGDINSSTGLRVGGNLVCDSTGCAASGSSGYYIQNGVATQANANFNIKTVSANDVVGILQGTTSQAVDLFQIKDSLGTNLFKVGNTGLTTINNGISFTGGNQTIQNNTGTLNVVANNTTFAINNTTVITSGDGTGIRYAGNYAYQPLSLVTRQYVDDSISGVVAGTCPTCFVNGGNSFGTSASVGTNDNNTFTIETANTSRIFLGTNGGVAMQSSTASGNYATASGASLASGDYSFAVGGGTASGLESFAGGYNINPITASGRGSMAFGSADNGAITAAGVGSVAIGNNVLANTVSGNWSTAIGVGARANGTGSMAVNAGQTTGDYSFAANAGSTASGLQSFAINNGTASGVNSFAGGYNAGGGAITAAGNGSMAFGYTGNGPITANGVGSFAGGNQTSTSVNGIYSIAYGYGAQANGNYSAAFNGSTASGTGATAIGSTLITASGTYSFAGGYGASAINSTSNGSFAFGRAGGYTIDANGEGSVALGFSNDGAITATGAGSLAGGNKSSTGLNGIYSIAYGYGTQANGNYSAAFNNATASGNGATAIGSTLVTSSGTYSFAGGYAQSAISSTTNGSFAFGRAGAYTITASGEGATALGFSRDGAILASGLGAFAGGTNSTASNEFAFAYGTGTQATGAYSTAFNNSVASNTGAFAINNATASGVLSFAGGSNGSQAYAQDSFAYGYNAKSNNINGIASVAFGRDTTANGSYSFAAGYGAASSGDASVALNYSSASGPGATSMGSTLVSSSGAYSFAGGYAQSVISATNNGSLAFGRSGGYTISSTGEGAVAFGASRDGAILASGYGAFAGGTASTASNEFAIAYGNGTQATGLYSAAFNNARATNTGAFATGSGTASGAGSFAGGYITSWAVPLTANGLGSFAYGRAAGFTITAAAEGSFALGSSRDGAITASGYGSLAGGTNSSTGAFAEFAIAYGTGTQATGAYSAAFNNSVASGTGAFAINNATASGLFSFAGGENGSLAAGRNSLAFGYTTKANNVSGQMSVALGRETLANGSYSFAMGYGAVASNDGAFAVGAGQASGAYSFAGYNSTASNTGAFAFGNTNTASNLYATSFGENNVASGRGALALGQNMTVSGNYSAGLNLYPSAASITADQTFAIMNGYVGINTTSPNASFASAFALVGNGYSYGSTVSSTGIASRVRAGDNVSGTLVQFERADATVVGSITHNGVNTAYNTSSDARLKHDITDTSLSLDTVLNLKVHDFKYNSDSTGTTYTGFIAQELQKLYPEAVSVMDTNTGYLGVDYGKLTPLLAKGIQDLNTKVDGIQSQVDALKNNQTSTSVDVLAELAKANAITLNGDLTVNGKVIVYGTLELKGDNKGTVTLPAGQTKVHISFNKGFSNPPSVTATPKVLSKVSYAVQNESTTGFDLIIDSAQTQDLIFNYQAL